MRATPTIARGPVARATRRPPGRADPHKRWTDRRGPDKTVYTYAANGQLAATADPDNRTTSYTYDEDGRLATKTAPGSLITTYGYDPASNLNSTSYSDGTTHSVTATFNPENWRTQMVDATGTTTETYDNAGNLKTIKNGPGKTVSYTYTVDELPLTIVYPATSAHTSGRTVTDGYDNADQLTSVKDWLGNTSTFGYDANSQLGATGHAIAYANGLSDTRTYDDAGDLTGIADTTSAGTLAAFTYGYDQDSQLTSESDTLNAATTNSAYAYTADNQIKTDPTGLYVDDPANQLSTTPAGTTYNYDNAGQLTTSTTGGASTSYGFNSRGDRTAVTPPSGGAATTLGYNQADELTSYTKGSSTVSYTNNGDGLRTTATGGTTATYTWDMTATVPELLDDGTTAYLYGPAGPFEQVTDTGDAVTYLSSDHQGSTRLLTGSTGTETASYAYATYGGVISHTGTTSTPLGYDGQYTDPTSGFVYDRARTYDGSNGQFLQADPLDAQTNQPYSYAGNDPIDVADPSGLCSILRCIGDVASGGLHEVGGIIQNSVPGQVLSAASKLTGKTLGGCISASILYGGAATGSICYVSTPSGQNGITVTGGAGAGAYGQGLLIGPTISNARNLSQLHGGFTQEGGGVGLGPYGAGESFQFGYDSCGDKIWQLTAGYAPGVEAGGEAEKTYTGVFSANNSIF